MIQNLVGCHNTPFVEDFSRYVNALFDPERWEVTGVVNAHDFNLQANYEFTFRVLRYLASLPKVSFMGLSELSETAAREDLPTLRI